MTISKGVIEQYQGPFEKGFTLTLDGYCIIGVSIGEDAYMKLGSALDQNTGQVIEKSFRFVLNDQQIWMGRTYLYETEEKLDKIQTKIKFPDGAPASVLVEVVHCSGDN